MKGGPTDTVNKVEGFGTRGKTFYSTCGWSTLTPNLLITLFFVTSLIWDLFIIDCDVNQTGSGLKKNFKLSFIKSSVLRHGFPCPVKVLLAVKSTVASPTLGDLRK